MPRRKPAFGTPKIAFTFAGDAATATGNNGRVVRMDWSEVEGTVLAQEAVLGLLQDNLIQPEQTAAFMRSVLPRLITGVGRLTPAIQQAVLKVTQSAKQSAGIKQHMEHNARRTKAAVVLAQPVGQDIRLTAKRAGCSIAHARNVLKRKST